MNDRSGWSIKGIHSRARDAAREAARQEGLTLGEYLNRLLTEESGALRGRQMNEVKPRRGAPVAPGYEEEDDPFNSLERLTNRIEAVEARSTLAISGIDQSVVGLLKRLEQADQANSELGGHVDGLMEDIRDTHDQLKAAIERLEADDSPRRALDGMRAIEGALAKLADHVYAESEASQNDNDAIKGRVEAGFTDLTDRVEGMEAAVNTRLREAGEAFDKAVDAAEQRSQGAANHLADRFTGFEQTVMQRLQAAEAAIGDSATLNQRVEALESGMSEAIGTLEDTLRNLQTRLHTAEAGTNSALNRLQETFGTLDTRIQSVASQTLRDDSHAMKVEFEARFEGLAKDLRSTIDRTRSELAGQIEAAATAADPAIFTALRADIDGVRVSVEQSEQRQQQALSVLGDRLDTAVSDIDARLGYVAEGGIDDEAVRDVDGKLDQFAASVEQRLAYVEAGVSGMGDANVVAVQEDVTRLGATIFSRIDGLEARETETVTRIGEQMTRLTSTLDERIEGSERNTASAIEQMGQTVANITRRMEARHNEALTVMDTKLVEAQQAQDARLDFALEQVSARLDDMQTVSRENVSPVQRAIASLAARLDALESFNAPPFTDKAIEQEAFGDGGPSRPLAAAPDAEQRPAAADAEAAEPATYQADDDGADGFDDTSAAAAPAAEVEAPEIPEAIAAAPEADTPFDVFEDDEAPATPEAATPGTEARADAVELASPSETDDTDHPPFPADAEGPDEVAEFGNDEIGDDIFGDAADEPEMAHADGAEKGAYADAAIEPGADPDAETAPKLTSEPPAISETTFNAIEALTGAPLKVSMRQSLARSGAPEQVTRSSAAAASADDAQPADVFSDAPPSPALDAGASAEASETDADPSDSEDLTADPISAMAAFEEAGADAEVDTAPEEEPYAADVSDWADLLTPEANQDFDTEPPSPDVTVGNYSEDFKGGFDASADDEHGEDGFDPISELENWSDASEPDDQADDETAGAAADANSDTGADLFETDGPPPPPMPGDGTARDIPRPALADHAMPLEDDTADYLDRARAAAIAAAEEAAPKKKKQKKPGSGNGGAKTSVIVMATAVGLATAGTAGYLYLRGKQSPASTMLSGDAARDGARTTSQTPAASDAAAMAALIGTIPADPQAATQPALGASPAPVPDANAPTTAPATALPIEPAASASETDLDAVLFDAAPVTPDAEPVAFAQAVEAAGDAIYPPIPSGRSILAAVEAGDPVAELLHGQDLIADGERTSCN
ncbi:MAG: hypothetical protein AAF253_03850, partial [Pseudomonadota bacterium]